MYGTIEIIDDFVETGIDPDHGPPGIGKTTMLREAARVLADELDKRVVVVDTWNEIAVDGDIPHPAIGKARRMQVRTPSLQHEVMIEAVESHMPTVIVIAVRCWARPPQEVVEEERVRCRAPRRFDRESWPLRRQDAGRQGERSRDSGARMP